MTAATGGLAPEVVVVGDVIDDLIVHLAAPIAAGTDTPARILARPGGSAANQAAWLARLGPRTTLVARVGAADRARHAAELAAHGVTARLAADPAAETGRIVVLVDAAGERSMLTDRGANCGLVSDDLPAPELAAARWLLLSGYALLDPATRPAAQRALALARTGGTQVALDPASAGFLAHVGPRCFRALAGRADLLLPNRDEALLLTGERDPERAAARLAAEHGLVAVTLGREGALLATRGEVLHEPAEPATVLDTTGAGDAFAAGLLAALLRDAAPREALRAALRAGALAVAVPGGRPRA